MCIKSHGFIPDESDRPPVANGGQDQVVQPQDSVTLNGIGSKDDHGIVSYKWQMLTEYPYAVTEVSEGAAIQTLFCYTAFSNCSLGKLSNSWTINILHMCDTPFKLYEPVI